MAGRLPGYLPGGIVGTTVSGEPVRRTPLDRDNLVGIILLALCAFVALIGGYAIATGNRLTYTGPSWVITVLSIFLLGAFVSMLVGAFRGRRRSGGGQQWPNPTTGNRPWWRGIWPFNRNDPR